MQEIKNKEVKNGQGPTEVNKTRVLTKKDVTKTYLRWWWTAELSNSFERMQALAVCASFTPALEKLYKRKEDLVDALKRHLQFFNTQAIWGGLIHGTVLAMEEEKATEGKIPGEVISGVKNGLMGPLAGIGDTLDFGTFQTIFLALGASFGAEGSVIGTFFPIMFSILLFCEGYYLFHLGYSLGRDSIKKILSGGIVNKIIDGASILGMFMMGALSATTVKLSTPLSFDIGGKAIVVQDTLNMIAPGLLPLGVVFFVYWGMKYKKWTITKLLVILVVLALVGSFIGIF
ncbi:PTS system mannose/fructose/sorbose family transporter subunit IID [Clostridioides difficile]|nr:PTS system mannose/fructose/sorbose family transporter subunit IID [Clostridioides difficile]